MATSAEDLWRYARAHHALGLALGLALVTAAEATVGSVTLALPVSGQARYVGIPFSRVLPIAYAALVVGSLHSRMEVLEQAPGRTLSHLRVCYLTSLIAISVLLLGLTELIMATPQLAAILVRALLVWIGLAVLSGRLFGWSLGWHFPW